MFSDSGSGRLVHPCVKFHSYPCLLYFTCKTTSASIFVVFSADKQMLTYLLTQLRWWKYWLLNLLNKHCHCKHVTMVTLKFSSKVPLYTKTGLHNMRKICDVPWLAQYDDKQMCPKSSLHVNQIILQVSASLFIC